MSKKKTVNGHLIARRDDGFICSPALVASLANVTAGARAQGMEFDLAPRPGGGGVASAVPVV